MVKSIIYYTDSRIREPIASAVRREIERSGLPVVSVSLAPLTFGENYVYEGKPGPYTMTKQILMALEHSKGDVVFFCEHDVLYPQSHFEFEPEKDDMFYYNDHVWRWDYPADMFITYDRLISLSSLCVNREYALRHYRRRIEKIEADGWQWIEGRDVQWARIMGFEPGTKKRKRGGFDDSDYETWRSREPIIDIRHNKTYSRRKCRLEDFKHAPKNWRETNVQTLQKLYGLEYINTIKK